MFMANEKISSYFAFMHSYVLHSTYLRFSQPDESTDD